MPANVYEGLVIFDSNRYARDPAGMAAQLENLITSAGGEVLASRLWEERRLAYPIRGNRKGTYWLTYFRINGSEISGMNRQCQISDSILRHLFIKIDPRLVETLVSHALNPEGASPEVPEADKLASDGKGESAATPAEAKPAEAAPAEAEPAEVETSAET